MSSLGQQIESILELAPDQPAIEFEEHWTSWGQLSAAIAGLDKHLAPIDLSDLRVGVLLRNRVEFVPTILSVLTSARTLVTLNPVYSDEQLNDDMKRADCPVIIAAEEDWLRSGVKEIAACSGALGISVRRNSDLGIQFDVVLAAEPTKWVRPQSPDVAIEMMTSGTTGTPKRIPLDRAKFERGAKDWGLFEKGRSSEPKLRNGVALLTTSFAHIAGIGALMNTVLAGRKACLLERFDLGRYVDAIVRHKPKVAGGPPAILRMLLDANIAAESLSSLVVFRTGTAPLDPALAAEFEAYFGVPVLQNYGATEFAGGVAGWSLEDHKRFGKEKLGSVGRLNPGVEGRIVDPESNANCEPGAIGVLELRAAHLGDNKDWLRTTDLAKIDEDGFLFIHGRADGAINRGGYKISPEDVIRAIEKHDAIREASVVGVDDARLGQVPVAAISLVSGAVAPTEDSLKAFLRDHLSPYQIPVNFKVVDEFPRTPSMKVSQAAIREMFS